MTLLLPVFLFYGSAFFPSVFSCFPLLLIVVLLLLLLFGKRQAFALFLLMLLVLFHIGGRAYVESVFTSALPEEEIVVLYGRIVSAPTRRKNRGSGYRLDATVALDQDGNAYTAKGVLYVISGLSDVGLGDEVAIEGKMGEGYFLSSSTELLMENPYGRARKRFGHCLMKLFPKGESGNLASLLLTGSSLDGTTGLSEKARQFGLSYLLALSGMHLALLALPLRPLFCFLGGKRWGTALLLLLLSFFVYSTGWKVSLFRALLFLVLSQSLETEYSFPLTCIFLLLVYPESMGEVGLSLSFVSLGGILFLSKWIAYPVKLVFPFFTQVTDAMAASLSALVFSVPLMMTTFGSWVPMALVLAFPAGIGILLVFYLIIISLFIPKTELYIDILLGFLQGWAETASLFHETSEWKCYWWFLGISIFLWGLGRLLLAPGWWMRVHLWVEEGRSFLRFVFQSS